MHQTKEFKMDNKGWPMRQVNNTYLKFENHVFEL